MSSESLKNNKKVELIVEYSTREIEEGVSSSSSSSRESSRTLLVDDENDKRNKSIQVSSFRRERLYWIDALRVLANFMVIFIHCTGVDLKPHPFKSKIWKIVTFYNIILKPCVPLFIMISGVFFLDPTRTVTISAIYSKSIPRLAKSYIVWSSFYNIVDEIFINIRGIKYHYSRTLVREVIKKSILGGGHLWYLNYAMGLYMLTPIFRELIPNKTLTWYTTGLSILVAQILPTIGDFYDTFTYRGFMVGRKFLDSLRLTPLGNYINYFMLGYLLNTYTLKKKWHIFIFYVIGIVGLVSSVILKFSSCYAVYRDSGAFSDYNSFNVTMETIGIFMFYKYTVQKYLKVLLKYRKFKKILIQLSDCSFGIYLIHMAIYHIIYRFNFHPLSFNPIVCAPLYSVLVYLISFICIYYLRKIPIIKYFM